ncbi:MAG: rhodanese-like domain-containing protein [Polycyclovorans sp.]|jgi:class 3 adenylate cyclase/rhodanese-related sulfurtransferase|nr:hypothetical protein [Gammaproteobacteria bacterium]MBU0875317.1 hypothetical protein [Alphaproteobacteria bacterium]MDP1542325.1 rhodanese-like domain-containing protein [Polycyclovorans sp.]
MSEANALHPSCVPDTSPGAGLQRLTVLQLKSRLDAGEAPLLLDVRRSEALTRNPMGIAGAVPILLDEADPKIPDVARDTEVVAYCLCSGQASSTRVALWLRQAGYGRVAVLDGGLPAWHAERFSVSPVSPASRDRIAGWISAAQVMSAQAPAVGGELIFEKAFLSGQALPLRREMAVLFVDMVNSTELLFAHPPEQVLALVQVFMEIVVAVAVQHCGDVHDFQGDGALLYFAGSGEALPAAFELREALRARRDSVPGLPEVRLALDSGPLIVGYVGGRERRALSFIGPSINTAARILKLAPPGGIAATENVLVHAQRLAPSLAEQFHPLSERQSIKGFPEPIRVFVAAPSEPGKLQLENVR